MFKTLFGVIIWKLWITADPTCANKRFSVLYKCAIILDGLILVKYTLQLYSGSWVISETLILNTWKVCEFVVQDGGLLSLVKDEITQYYNY